MQIVPITEHERRYLTLAQVLCGEQSYPHFSRLTPPVSRWDAVRHQEGRNTHKWERSEGSEHGTDKSVPYKVCRHSSYKWERGEKREGCALSVAARQLSQRESPWQLPGEYTVFQNILSRAVLSNRLYKTGWPVRNRWRSQTAATGE